MNGPTLAVNAKTLQFLRFALVGAGGFVVDAATLNVAMHWIGAGLYVGRILSYLTAATFTWALNRRYTFHAQRGDRLLREWLKFLAANAAGGFINYAVYVSLVAASSFVAMWPVIGVAAGSLCGLIVNFLMTKRLVFKTH